MNEEIINSLNIQVKEELYSAYLYLSMSAYCMHENLEGFANWFKVQAQEEMDHAFGFYCYILQRDAKVELQEIPKPPSGFDNPATLFKDALKHEKYITGKIHELYELSLKNKDYALQSFLGWYIDEQVEEESSASKMVELVKLIGDTKPSIYLLDKELALRKYVKSKIVKDA